MADLPGGGPARPIGIGMVGAGTPRPCGVITCTRPPTPRTGPARPAGAWAAGAPAGIPLPAARPTPGPPIAPGTGTRAIPLVLTSLGGGPSTVIETRLSPRKRTKPSTRFSSRSPCLEFLATSNNKQTNLIFLNSSQSQRMRFICLSKALKVPMKTRPSCSVQRMR
uniref:Uncharacterized protein n=1 Tax=Eptatretus burgeri TaxID=7764 RepID=A0A8C4Q8V9_EPTBU